jgi:nitrate/nitrite-specific signal transduction histidine kinase
MPDSDGSSTDPAAAAAGGDSDLATTKKEFIQTFFKRAEEFTETLLRENERLRFQILELEEKIRARDFAPFQESNASGALRELLSRIESLEQEREQMLARFRSVQRENLDFEERSREIERENNNLANLYVASFQLHSTLDLREVTQIILEILLNFVGAKTFAIMLVDEQEGLLKSLATEGIAREKVPAIKTGEGTIGAVVSTGKMLVDDTVRGPLDLSRPLIVSPLRIKDKVVGAIVVWEFLQQKTELADVDHELLNLLAAHAASALQGAKLAHELGNRSAGLWGAVDLV